jgi:glycosyltransferase involved in cell wall biosynthesis
VSVCAVMLVKDEADVVAPVIRHLLCEVDEVIVADNLSTDGTSEILAELARETGRVEVRRDDEVGYYQARKMTALAQEARRRGHAWVVPCDADEVWYSPLGRIGDVLDAHTPDWLFSKADLYDHITTNADPPYANPLERIGWRFAKAATLCKTAARTHETLQIEMGNHDASIVAGTRVRSNGAPPTMHGQLVIRHFSWRSPEQFLRKIRNGAVAYASAPDLDDGFGEHWKMYGDPNSWGFDDRVLDNFYANFTVESPATRSDLLYDPAPVSSARA